MILQITNSEGKNSRSRSKLRNSSLFMCNKAIIQHFSMSASSVVDFSCYNSILVINDTSSINILFYFDRPPCQSSIDGSMPGFQQQLIYCFKGCTHQNSISCNVSYDCYNKIYCFYIPTGIFSFFFYQRIRMQLLHLLF